MLNKKFVKIFFIFLFFIVCALMIYLKSFKTAEIDQKLIENEEIIYNSNIIQNVEYSTKDAKGNEYLIRAEEGEIDFSSPNIIFLKKVYAKIRLIDSEDVIIVSDFGKYNSENFDTIFSKNIIINYEDNKITGEYLDFSLERNSIIISKNVNYINFENILNADIVEINIQTKDTKIFMYDNKKKVNIRSKS